MTKRLVLILLVFVGILIGCQDSDSVTEIDYEGYGEYWRADLNYEEEQRNNGEYAYEIQLTITQNGKLGEHIKADQMGYILTLGNVAIYENHEEYDETQEVSALYIKGEGVSDTSLSETAEINLEVFWDQQTEIFQLNVVELEVDN